MIGRPFFDVALMENTMAKLFNKLPGFTKTPPGEERRVLRLLPKVLVLGSLLLTQPALLVRLLVTFAPELETATLVSTVDIYSISLVVLHWTVVLTVGIGAFIVMVMKGPAYVADAYPLIETDEPDLSRPGQ